MDAARKINDEEFRPENYDPDLLEFKRRMEADGCGVRIPRKGARFRLPAPIDFGVSLSDVVIRNRGKEP